MSTTTFTTEALRSTIIDVIVEIGAEPDDITDDATLESLDLDSLDLIEIAQVVEETFGVAVKPEEATGLSTVGEVIDLLARAASR